MTNEDEVSLEPLEKMQMTTDIIASYTSKNSISPDDLPALIKSVHCTMISLGNDKTIEKQKPAVPVSRSITDDYVVCLEDGARLKMLKRYIRTRYNLTPDEYRQKWGLPTNYPMVAPAYARRRSEFAKKIGLGKGTRKAVA